MSTASQVQTKPAANPGPLISRAPQSGLAQRKCACGESPGLTGECAGCNGKRLTLQRRPGNGPDEHSSSPPIVSEVLRSSGQPLDAATRDFITPRLGHDFSRVRVHTDARAAESARAVNALAYTVGQEIVFGAGQYLPETTAGRRLLVHELVHTAQQGPMDGPIQRAVPLGPIDSPLEREADRIADSIAADAGQLPNSRLASGPLMVQRACAPFPPGSVTGCIGLSGDAIGDHFLFVRNCDDFQPGEEARLRLVAPTVGPNDTLDIHGFASEEGPVALNEDLSCSRAQKARTVLIAAGVSPMQINSQLFMHGATAGPRPDRRSVVINKQTNVPLPKCGPDATDWFVRQVNTATTDTAVLAIQTQIAAADAIARTHGTSAQEVAEGGAAAAVVAQLARMGSAAPPMPPGSAITTQLPAGSAAGAAAASSLSLHPIDAAQIAALIGSAAVDWRTLVNHGARYDFKAHTMRGPTTAHCPGSACTNSITLCPGAVPQNCYLTDLPGNLFYALIGRFVGWSALTLQLGSQLAQLTGTASWDPPEDTAAIRLGFSLPLPMSASGLCGLLPPARGSLTAQAGCEDCTEPTTAAIR